MNETLQRRYAGKRIVVTGVTSGNGRALANLLLTLGAVVIGIGRNHQRLEAFRRQGGVPYQLDLGRPAEIGRFLNWLRSEYRLCDGLFHLAGGGIIGKVSELEFKAFEAADYTGPVRLAEGMLSLLNRGSTVAMVTSGSVALAQGVPELAQYVRVKEMMVAWCARNRDYFGRQGVNVMLIAMGAIGSDIWTTAGGFAKPFGWLARHVLPAPERYSEEILMDAAKAMPATYPGLFAGLTEFSRGEYRPVFPVVGPPAKALMRMGLLLARRRF